MRRTLQRYVFLLKMIFGDIKRKIKLTRVIWSSRDNSTIYYYSLVSQKLKNILNYITNDSPIERPKSFEYRIKTIIKLCDHLSKEDRIYPAKINTKNAKRHDIWKMIYLTDDNIDKCDNDAKSIIDDARYKIDFKTIYKHLVYDLKARYIVHQFLNYYLPFYED